MPWEPAISFYTRGRVTVDLNQLRALFGGEPHDEVPLHVHSAEVHAEPRDAVHVVWHCFISKELFAQLAPELAAADATLYARHGGWEICRPAQKGEADAGVPAAAEDPPGQT